MCVGSGLVHDRIHVLAGGCVGSRPLPCPPRWAFLARGPRGSQSPVGTLDALLVQELLLSQGVLLLLLFQLLLTLHELLVLQIQDLLLLLLLHLLLFKLLLSQELLMPYLLEFISWGRWGTLGDLAQRLSTPRRALDTLACKVAYLAAVAARYALVVLRAILGGVVMCSAEGTIPDVTHCCGAWWAPCALGTGRVMLRGGWGLLLTAPGPGGIRPAGLPGREKVWVAARCVQVRSFSSF